jgi:hypothetical protein
MQLTVERGLPRCSDDLTKIAYCVRQVRRTLVGLRFISFAVLADLPNASRLW